MICGHESQANTSHGRLYSRNQRATQADVNDYATRRIDFYSADICRIWATHSIYNVDNLPTLFVG